MHGHEQFQNLHSRTNSGSATTAVAVIVLALGLTQLAPAQTFSVIYNFTGAQDGSGPQAGLVLDHAGTLYGTASGSTLAPGCGTVFSLRQRSSNWIFNTLYTFKGPAELGTDGCYPVAPVTIGSDGSLYGTTWTGGTQNGGCSSCGTVFYVKPPAGVCRTTTCEWTETVIHSFAGVGDGAVPAYGGVSFDQAGNLYGTTSAGGYYGLFCANGGCGTLYQLAPVPGGGWTENTLHAFTAVTDGSVPYGPVVIDRSGNLYTTAISGGPSLAAGWSCGLVYQLTPSGGQWLGTPIHIFICDINGESPIYLIMDPSGNLYGSDAYNLYELAALHGGLHFSVTYNFVPLGVPWGMVMDGAGNIYGNAYNGGAQNCGFVFKLTPSQRGWTFADLHDFRGRDGCFPMGNPVLDSRGNLYGTASYGGTSTACDGGCGTAWEITP